MDKFLLILIGFLFLGCQQDPQPRKSYGKVEDVNPVFYSKLFPGGRPSTSTPQLGINIEGQYDLQYVGLAHFQIDASVASLQRDVYLSKKSLALFMTLAEFQTGNNSTLTGQTQPCSSQGYQPGDCYFLKTLDWSTGTDGIVGTPNICSQACSQDSNTGAVSCDPVAFAQGVGRGVFYNKYNMFTLGSVREKAYLEVSNFFNSNGQRNYSHVVLIPDLDSFCNAQVCLSATGGPSGACYYVGPFPNMTLPVY